MKETNLIKSWIDSANQTDNLFPVNNLPCGVFSAENRDAHCGVAIGDLILDVTSLEERKTLVCGKSKFFHDHAWNLFMASDKNTQKEFREKLTVLLADNTKEKDRLQPHLISSDKAKMHLPFRVAEYTDFYAGKQHAMNVGTMFRGPENALPPNWLHIPIGYNGRSSTIVIDGTDFHRPSGQTKPPSDAFPSFGPCKRLDFELELGAVVGTPSDMGKPFGVAEADEKIFGYVLLNDWSARDIQAWEYQPLGPFQAKAFATTISPWIVTKEALEPFKFASPVREKELLPYLQDCGEMLYDISLSVGITPAGKDRETCVSATNYDQMYYSAAQQLAHHSSSGCKMNTGDLLGSGTVSGKNKSAFGSLLEITWGGKEPLTLDNGEQRTFLEDGDTVTLYGFSQGNRYRIGFGRCSGKVLPALPIP